MNNEILYGLIGIGIIVFTIIIIQFGSKTYYIDINTLCKLLKNTTYKNAGVSTPFDAFVSTSNTFKTNCIGSIPCTDKKGTCFDLINSPQIEVRISTKAKKRTLLYFDTLFLEGDYIVGCRSRFIASLKKKILISEIAKVEVQEGGKKHKYV